MRAAPVLIGLLVVALALVGVPAAAQPGGPTAGERVYRQGVLPSGEPLRGERNAGIRVEGEAAACVICHRRSGFGSAEGQIIIPPVTGTYLFRPRGKQIEDMDLRYLPQYKQNREAHTDASMARAIREGIGRNGQALSFLMPRFALDDATMASLIAYLKNLSVGPYAGVTADTLHFATIITPDADPVKRQGMLDVLERFFADKNEFVRGGQRTMQRSTGVSYRVVRRWQLHVWQLTGPEDTWEKQLQQRLAAEPVFAVISGLGGKTWAPVHHFCEQAAIPCLLPNVDLPVVEERDFYSLYFGKGVLLEAQLIAGQLSEAREKAGLHRLLQVYRVGDIGEPAAQALRAAAAAAGLTVEDRVIKAGATESDLAAGLNGAAAGDALMLWLRPDDLARLPAAAPAVTAAYVSGLMGNLENAPLPAAWRKVARMTYPADVPELRKFRMNFPLTWFKIRRIPLVAERVQSDTYLACGILAETLTDMLDSFVREYLVERIEDMLSYRAITGYYPRLGLAQGQRFASKGGYIVRFAEPAGTRVVADGAWTIP
jgi:hypothetical protein